MIPVIKVGLELHKYTGYPIKKRIFGQTEVLSQVLFKG